MEVKPCRSYHGRVVDRRLLESADGRSAFKLYFVSITGRAEPERFEWERSPLDPRRVEAALRDLSLEGVGFAVLFPHIAKCFRFSPEAEIVLDVQAFDTSDNLAPLDLNRGEGWLEFACYAEAALAADEYRAWAESASVADYLAYLSPFTDAPILSHTKMGEWFSRGA